MYRLEALSLSLSVSLSVSHMQYTCRYFFGGGGGGELEQKLHGNKTFEINLCKKVKQFYLSKLQISIIKIRTS
jgi:hypothetical protein